MSELSRRGFLAGAGAAAAVAWVPAFRVGRAAAATTPPAFPASIPLYQQGWRNWAGEIAVDSVWTATPATPDDVVTIVNWAHAQGWTVRPRGIGHNWSPLLLRPGTADTVLLVDTTAHLTASSVSGTLVTAQTGLTMEALLTRMEAAGLGFTAVPAPGDLTVGGVLAIDGHGTGVPARGEARPAGTTYGTLSHLVRRLTAVVWDGSRYALRTFDRSDPAIRPLLVSLGRAFVTEVTLQAGANQRLRCQSRVDIPATELFGSSGRTFASFLDSAGRAEAIWFPFTANPWLKVWSVRPTRPLLSRPVSSPYNYPFSDALPGAATDLLARILTGHGELTPAFGQAQYAAVAAGLVATGSWDLWGWSRATQLYVRPTTLRVTANGYAVQTRRADVQQVIRDFTGRYSALVNDYRARGLYPANGPVEIRVTGLDQPGDVGADAPLLSAASPAGPDREVAVWLDVLTVPGTPGAAAFYRDLEQWIFAAYPGAVRPEWSKGWGYTTTAAWAEPAVLAGSLPAAYGSAWSTAVAGFRALDPHGVVTSPFLDTLLR
jgi:FAD/FMN-containing dehydrogenase